MPPPCRRLKNPLALLEHITQQCSRRATKLTSQAHSLHQALKKVMRCFGRQCRGHGHVVVQLVRHTAQQLLELGKPLTALGQQAQQLLGQASALSDSTRERLADAFNAAMSSHTHIRKPSTPLTHGKKLSHCTSVHAYDPTLAPILKGTSNCPAQFGRKPGLVSEPATGCIFANRVPEGHPCDASSVLPLLDQVQRAIKRVRTTPRLQVHAVAGDLGSNEAALRQALHQRALLTVGLSKTVEPMQPHPRPEEVRAIRNEAGFHRKRTPHQVHLACACGSSRPVVESHIASLLSRGAGQVRYKGPLGAMRQQGMTVMAHTGAPRVRIRQQHRSNRAQKFRRLLGLRRRKIHEINNSKN